MSWGRPKRPITSNKLGAPSPREGSEGDIQVRQTSIGGKLFAKLGGRWHNTYLTDDENIKIGTNTKDYLDISPSGLSIIKDSQERLAIEGTTIKLKDTAGATAVHIDNSNIILGGGGAISISDGTRTRFRVNTTDLDMWDEAGNNVLNMDTGVVTIGHHATTKIVLDGVAGTMVMGKFSANSSGVINVDDITLDGKIILSSTGGSQNVCIGSGNTDVDGMVDNVSIGVNAGSSLEDGGVRNVCIGTKAGEDITTGDANVCIGTEVGKDITTGSANTCVGVISGQVIQTGSFNTYIGYQAQASGAAPTNEVVICGGKILNTAGNGDNTVTLGTNDTDMQIYCGQVQGALVRLTSLDFKERTSEAAKPADAHAVIFLTDGTGIGDDGDVMIASNVGGTIKYATLFDHSAGSTWS